METINNLLSISNKNISCAKKIIDELKIVEIWEKHGAKANLVGSVRMELMMKHLDIDFHIYSKSFSIAESFAAIADFAGNNGIKQISYSNLIDNEDRCLEWHLSYLDNENTIWQLDMIHILNDSPYVGYFETMADKISAVVTPEQKMAVLSIKNDVPENEFVMGVEIYQAVIRDAVHNYKEFAEWHKTHKANGIIKWIP